MEFTEDALKAIAEEAIRRNTGARGLRAIMEETMLMLCMTFQREPILQNVS